MREDDDPRDEDREAGGAAEEHEVDHPGEGDPQGDHGPIASIHTLYPFETIHQQDEGVQERARQELDALINRLERVPELPMRRVLAMEWIALHEDAVLSWGLAELLRASLRGSAGASSALFAICLALIDHQLQDDRALFERLFFMAHTRQQEELLYLFRDASPEKILPDESKLPEVRLPLDRDLTLGARRSLAMGSERRFLERLIHDPDPLVLQKILLNPSIQKQDVVLIASRRPTIPPLLETILSQWRWMRHHEVREALARNPYIQTGYALKILPTLHIHVLREIAQSGELHHGLKRFAALLLSIHSWQLPG